MISGSEMHSLDGRSWCKKVTSDRWTKATMAVRAGEQEKTERKGPAL